MNYNANYAGKQPVKALEDVLEGYKKEVLKNLNLLKYENVFDFDFSEKPIRTGPFANLEKRIVIEETFQSFIWIWGYCLLVLYDEGISKPRLNLESSKSKIKEAFELLEYGYSLLNGFNKWNLSMPNPLEYNVSNNFYIEKANGIYLIAMNEVFLHEIAHIDNGDIDKLIAHIARQYVITLDERRSFEYKADEFAYSKLVDGINNPVFKSTIRLGLIAGFSALIIIQKSLRDYSGQYPDADERFKIAMQELSIDEEDNMWGVACLAWKLWSDKNSKDLGWALSYDTYKELFEATVIKVDEFK